MEKESQMIGNSDLTPANLDGKNFVMGARYDLSKNDLLISSADVKDQDVELDVSQSAGSAGIVYLYKEQDRRLRILPGNLVNMVN
jgi:hypothetical protein